LCENGGCNDGVECDCPFEDFPSPSFAALDDAASVIEVGEDNAEWDFMIIDH
jgi:hypothetical protein